MKTNNTSADINMEDFLKNPKQSSTFLWRKTSDGQTAHHIISKFVVKYESIKKELGYIF